MFARPGLPAFEYVCARSRADVVRILERQGEAARLMMGGTDLFPALRGGSVQAQVIVDLKGLPGIQDIRLDEAGQLVVGAAVTMNQLVSHNLVRERYPLLAEAASTVASYQVRNRATLGGNLCNASPCSDTAPAVLVLGGELCLDGRDGERWVPAQAFFQGPGKTVLGPAEFLAAIRLPVTPLPSAGRYLKLGRTKAGDLALVGVAVLGYPDAAASGGYCFRIGLGSVAPIPFRAAKAEELLASRAPAEDQFAMAARVAQDSSSPISDVRGSAAYQQAMVHRLVLRGLRDVWEQLRPS